MRLAKVGFTSIVSLAAIPLFAQPPDQRLRFEISADAVRLDIAVTTSDGRYVPGLSVDDFQIYENGELQNVTNFTAEPTPVSIVLLLDVSSSIRPSIDGIKAGAYRFLGGLREEDVALVGFFNHKIRFTERFTADPVVLAREIRSMRASGMTALYDAVFASLEELSSRSGRKALVVFADGDDSRPAAEGSVASPTDAWEAGKTSDVSIYTVGFRGRRAAGRGVNRGFLRRLAADSGGLAFFPNGTAELARSFDRVQNELRSLYQLAYTPTNRDEDGAWRTIEVKIDGAPHLIARTRQGYYANVENESTK